MKPVQPPKRSSLPALLAKARPPAGPAPLVSVVIPTHERASLVGRAIESALRQTVSDLEVIVVDDASTDATKAVVAMFDDTRLRYVRLAKNGGVARARNTGIAKARGEWIAFLDDDDEWVPEKLERQFARLDGDDDIRTSLVYSGAFHIVRRVQRPPRGRPGPEGDISAAILIGDVIPRPSSCLVKRSALVAAEGFDETLVASEDTDLWLRLLQAGHRFVAARERLLIVYDRHGHGQLTKDPVTQARAQREMRRRWGPLMKGLIGAERYKRHWRDEMRRLRKMHLHEVKRMERAGDRTAARRYVREMLPVLPWGRRYVIRALRVALFGARPAPTIASKAPPRRSSLPELMTRARAPDGPAPLISVIILTHNRAPLVGRAIESVLGQTFRDIELIVIDDGSVDETAEVVRRIDDPRSRYVYHSRTRGESYTRNDGIAQARGEYIAMLDDDDEWLPTLLERLLTRIGEVEDPRVSAAYCRSYWARHNREMETAPKGELAEGDGLASLPMATQTVLTSAYLTKRQAMIEGGGYDETLFSAPDIDMWVRLALLGHRFAVVDEPLIIKHDDHPFARITMDPISELHGMVEMTRRWGKIFTERTPDAFAEWYHFNDHRIRRMHQRHVRRLIDEGSGLEALRYVWRMRPMLPWGALLVAKALAFGLVSAVLAAPRSLIRALAGDRPRRIENRRSRLSSNAAVSSDAGPAVSVVIPTYNRAALLPRAVESVLAQTFREIEVIIVDDASTDETQAVVRSFDDARVRSIRFARNRGVCYARNAGIAQARGEWVAFLDCDDEWLPEKLERQLARVHEGGGAPSAAVYSRCFVSTEDGVLPLRPRSEMPDGDISAEILRNKIPLVPSVYVVRRSALLAVRGFDETMSTAEDADLWLRLTQAGYRFAVVAEPLAIKHHDHELEQFEKDPVVRLRWFRAMDRRWGQLMRERLGYFQYDRWRHNKLRRFRRRHKKYVRILTRRGTRRDALRYAFRMLPFTVWGRRYVRKALKFAILGREAKPERPSKQKVSQTEASR